MPPMSTLSSYWKNQKAEMPPKNGLSGITRREAFAAMVGLAVGGLIVELGHRYEASLKESAWQEMGTMQDGSELCNGKVRYEHMFNPEMHAIVYHDDYGQSRTLQLQEGMERRLNFTGLDLKLVLENDGEVHYYIHHRERDEER